MKRPTIKLFLFGAIGAASVTQFGGAAIAATEVKISHPYPSKHGVHTDSYEPFAKYVETETKGSLSFKIFPGEALLTMRATVGGLRDRVADMGAVLMPQAPAQFPNGTYLSDLSIMGTSATAMAGATMEFYYFNCSECLAEFSAQNSVFGGAMSTSPYNLINKSPLLSLADLKGKKLRTPGPSWNRWMAAVGAIAVNVPSNEMYEALNRGVVDGVVHAPASLKNYSLWDVAKNLTTLPLGTYNAASLGAMNHDFWRERSLVERRAILDGIAILATGVSINFGELDAAALKEASAHGLAVHQASGDMIAATKAFIAADLNEAAKFGEAKYGVKNAAQKAEVFHRLVQKWEKLTAPVESSREKVTAIYRAEITDKIDAKTFGM